MPRQPPASNSLPPPIDDELAVTSVRYNLTIVQHPTQVRTCGFGDKDKRPIDPPPVIRLEATDMDGEPIDPGSLAIPLYVLHVTLRSATNAAKECTSVHGESSKNVSVLLGSLVATPKLLKNENGEPGCYFCYTDVRIRTQGTYRFGYSLIKVGSNTSGAVNLASVTSDPIRVFPAKDFPGTMESTALSMAFKSQGIHIPVRNRTPNHPHIAPEKTTEKEIEA